jgi:hypothetical protein
MMEETETMCIIDEEQVDEERAQRAHELAQLKSRRDQVKNQWLGGFETESIRGTIYDSVKEAFADRDVSPFMIVRVADICIVEYRSLLRRKGLRRLENDNRMLINWMFEEHQKEDSRTREIQVEIAAAKKELEELRRKKIEELKITLQSKRRELLRLISLPQGVEPRQVWKKTLSFDTVETLNTSNSGTSEECEAKQEAPKWSSFDARETLATSSFDTADECEERQQDMKAPSFDAVFEAFKSFSVDVEVDRVLQRAQ